MPAASSTPLTCTSTGARAAPSTLGLLVWPAAHPLNAQQVDLIVAPQAACQTITSTACATPAAITGVGGAALYLVGTAASMHLEAAEGVTCTAQ